ncbi:MAG: hypothetical protein IPK53_04025 [bacterium]|nr:hypothetical protein [bacterium]
MKALLRDVIATLSTAAFAVVPQLVNYQGSLTYSTGSPMDTTVTMTFHLYDGATGGAELLWSEVQPVVVVQKGLFNSVLGSVTALEDSVLKSTELWLGIAVGGDPEMMPRTKIQSVPYALRAGTVDQSSGGTGLPPFSVPVVGLHLLTSVVA